MHRMINVVIIHQIHYEKSDWSRAFNQFTIACELDIINLISAANIAFIMSSSTSAWLLSPLECSPQKQNGWMLRFCFWGWIMWKMYNKTIIEFGFRMISWIIKTSCLCYLPQPSASANNIDLSFANSYNLFYFILFLLIVLKKSVGIDYNTLELLHIFIDFCWWWTMDCIRSPLATLAYIQQWPIMSKLIVESFSFVPV